MSTDAYLDALKRNHRNLDVAIWTEMKKPHADDRRLKLLKMEKLKLKDQIAAISRNAGRRSK